MFLPDSHALLAHPPHRHASAAPPAADGEPVTDDDAQAMWQLARAIEAGVDEDWPLARLARQAGRSRFQVQRLFSRVVGVSPRAFHTGARFAHLKRQLRGGATVTDAIHDAGFGSVSRVYEHLDDTLGMTPSRYRAGGAGEVILYACRETALGWLMLAATPRGVCAAHFGDDPDALVANLERLFPAADRAPSRALDDPELDRWIDAIDAHLADRAPLPDLPLDVRGTAFQVRVWQLLRRVRAGETITYSALARALDRPRAARAVAGACAANRIALLLPCHRVLRSDGGLGGYRWGIHRKRALLAREGAAREA